MDATNNFGKENALEVDFDMGIGYALAEVVHYYIAEKKLPIDAVLSISMTLSIDKGHHETCDGDAFAELCSAMNVNLQLS